ncbi:MAG: hypothetical protein LBT39_06205, partial [Treponema sp.]|nr:hypothetical protein [Treponema sp.]
MARHSLQKGMFFSPVGIFIGYILAAVVAVLGFRFLLPGEGPPLPIFSLSWRITQGVLAYIDLFPALAMTALIIPFGMKRDRQDQFAGFSPYFLEAIKRPIISAICAVALYGVLCFLVYPLAWDREAEMRFKGQLFT